MKDKVSDDAEKVMQKVKQDFVYWQRQLRLDDIEFDIRWMGEFEQQECVGCFYMFSPSHKCIIAIRQPDHLPPAARKNFNCDYEVILVHELLHAREARWKESGEAMEEVFEHPLVKHNYEVSLDAIAEALVRARRGITR